MKGLIVRCFFWIYIRGIRTDILLQLDSLLLPAQDPEHFPASQGSCHNREDLDVSLGEKTHFNVDVLEKHQR